MRLKAYSALLVVTLLITVVFSGHSFANTSSCSSSTASLNCFNGAHYYAGSSSTLTRISADLSTSSYPVVGSGSVSSGWVMLSPNGSSGWVQVGWLYNNGTGAPDGGTRPNGMHYVFEVNTGVTGTNNDIHDTFSVYGPATNSTHTYKVELVGNSYYGYEDDALIATTAKYFTANVADFSEEIAGGIQSDGTSTTWKAAYGGTNSNRVRFSNLQVVKDGSTVYSPSVSWLQDTFAGQDNSNYSTSGYFDIWDTRY